MYFSLQCFLLQIFEELCSAFLVICQFEVNIVSIISHNEFFCNGLDLQCGIEGTEEERVKNLDTLIAKYRFKFFYVILLIFKFYPY